MAYGDCPYVKAYAETYGRHIMSQFEFHARDMAQRVFYGKLLGTMVERETVKAGNVVI